MSLLLIRSGLQKQIRSSLAADLSHSTVTFENLQRQRQQMLDRAVALLADLPSLKALMTTQDLNTIQDGGTEFWKVSGSDLFALLDESGTMAAVYANGGVPDRDSIEFQLRRLVTTSPDQRYLLSNHRLYYVAFRPLYFGTEATGTPLGFVVAGSAIDARVSREVSEAAAADAIFLTANEIVSSTLDTQHNADLQALAYSIPLQATGDDLRLGNEHYLADSVVIPTLSDVPVRLLVLKSFDQASQFAMHLNRMILALGVLVLLIGTLVGLYISGIITRPLDALVAGARALGLGDFDYQFERGGIVELNELSMAFDRMRNQLRESQQELIESARLAIIGRMASSISHDLRHYLSAIYANAEFLSHSSIPPAERDELMGEMKVAVQGMTDVLESLVVFSRTGRSLNPSYESLSFLVERAVALVRMHPDAQQVSILVEPMPQIETWIDARMIERAVCNLLLNAVQAAKSAASPAWTKVSLDQTENAIEIRITDSGPGVPVAIRDTLFEPFVSTGKRRGIGLGLTIAHRIAQEHGGDVRLEESNPGRTTFLLFIAKGLAEPADIEDRDQSAPLLN